MSEPVALPDVSPVPLVRSRRDPAATRRRWVERMGRFATCSLTVAEFCAAEGVSVPAFYQWKRTLAAADTLPSSATPPTFVPRRYQTICRRRSTCSWTSHILLWSGHRHSKSVPRARPVSRGSTSSTASSGWTNSGPNGALAGLPL